ncbi:hypothetical protein N431DRAFT_208210 [Stipitochalara longipes BDJ]|nr:hypothetical protein N431DRAFT_208210 [Stipitochalara longipes BDJ]
MPKAYSAASPLKPDMPINIGARADNLRHRHVLGPCRLRSKKQDLYECVVRKQGIQPTKHERKRIVGGEKKPLKLEIAFGRPEAVESFASLNPPTGSLGVFKRGLFTHPSVQFMLDGRRGRSLSGEMKKQICHRVECRWGPACQVGMTSHGRGISGAGTVAPPLRNMHPCREAERSSQRLLVLWLDVVH